MCGFIKASHYFKKSFLVDVIKNCMIHNQMSTINYFLLSKYLKPTDQIIRIGGDGDYEVSIQTFSIK